MNDQDALVLWVSLFNRCGADFGGCSGCHVRVASETDVFRI